MKPKAWGAGLVRRGRLSVFGAIAFIAVVAVISFSLPHQGALLGNATISRVAADNPSSSNSTRYVGSVNSTSNSSTYPPCSTNCLNVHYNSSGYDHSINCQSCSGVSPQLTVVQPADAHLTTDSYGVSQWGHYYTSLNYGGLNTAYHASTVYTTIGTPSSGPRHNDLYYELLSAWDSDNLYDQIGIASAYCQSSTYNSTLCQNNNDAWSVLISQANTQSGTCGLHYSSTATAAYLDVNSHYTFQMSIWKNGANWEITFDVYSGDSASGIPYYNYTVGDPADYFYINAGYNWGSGCNAGGLTVYQEMYHVTNAMSFPQWNFNFYDTNFTSGGTTYQVSKTQWTNASNCVSYPYCPPWPAHHITYDWGIGSYDVRIKNIAFSIYWPNDAFNVTQGGSVSMTTGAFNAVGPYCQGGSNCTYSLSCTYPTGTQLGSCGYSGYYIPYSPDDYSFTLFSNAATGTYYSGTNVTVSSLNEYTTFLFYTTIT